MPVDSYYDDVVLGSSPVSMVEALYHARRGRRVLLVEQKSVLGGAWSMIDTLGLRRIENGCHLLTPADEEVYAFLETALGMELHPLAPQPFAVREGRVTLRNEHMVYRYPRRGTVEMVGALQHRLQEAGCHILTRSALTEATYDPAASAPLRLTLSTGHRLRAGHLVLTGFTQLRAVRALREAIDLSGSAETVHHIFFLVASREERRFTCVHLPQEPVIRLANDLTETARHFNRLDGQKVFTVKIDRRVPGSDITPAFVEKVWARLLELSLVSPRERIEAYAVSAYPYVFRTSEQIEEVSQALPDAITFLPSRNLVQAFAEQLPRWREAV